MYPRLYRRWYMHNLKCGYLVLAMQLAIQRKRESVELFRSSRYVLVDGSNIKPTSLCDGIME